MLGHYRGTRNRARRHRDVLDNETKKDEPKIDGKEEGDTSHGPEGGRLDEESEYGDLDAASDKTLSTELRNCLLQ